MAKITTAERVSREASDNFVFQRSLLAYHAAAQRISGDVLEIGTGAGYGIEVVAPRARSFVTIDKLAPAPEPTQLVGFRPESTGTKLSEPVRFLTNVNKKRCTTFILSDFMDSSKDKAALDDALKIAGGKHDLVGIRVYDPRETELPDVGIVELKDAESGRKVWVDTSSRAVREHYARTWERRSAEIDSTLKHNRIDSTMISTDGDYVAELLKLFKQR